MKVGKDEEKKKKKTAILRPGGFAENGKTNWSFQMLSHIYSIVIVND